MHRQLLLWRSWILLAGMLLLAGSAHLRLAPPEASGELVVATLMSPTTYFIDANDREAGYEHDLTERFAKIQGWQVRYLVVHSMTDLFESVRQGRAHLAASGLTVTRQREKGMRFGPVYEYTAEWVACRQSVRQPANAKELFGLRLEVSAGSSHAEHLAELRRQVPGLTWVEASSAASEDLFDRVEIGLADCTVADAGNLDLGRNFHPNLKPAFLLADRQPRAWLLGRVYARNLLPRLQRYFAHAAMPALLDDLRERYFGHVRRLSEADVLGILDKRNSLLREYRSLFQSAQDETGLDWRLIAAVAYQESQWNSAAVSPTGVRGIMMLTETTADELGVSNRLDPAESIPAGARYLARLRDGIQADIAEPDRTWMALAAYNIGRSHFEDARRLTQKLGKDPDRWSDVKNVLPLLASPARAADLRYGFARGGEARAFTENVRIYYDILKRYEAAF